MRRFWAQRGITTKVVLVFVGIVLFYLAAVVVVQVTAAIVREELNNTLTSLEVQRLVLEMDNTFKDTRQLESEFFLQYPLIGISEARRRYALPAAENIARLESLSRALRSQIENAPEVASGLQARDIDLTLYLSTAERNSTVFFDAVEIVTQLAAPEGGLEAQWFQQTEALDQQFHDINRAQWYAQFHHMIIFGRDYLITRQRSNFQSAANEATRLTDRIARDRTLDPATRRQLLDGIAAHIATGEAITALDSELRSKLNDLGLQSEQNAPIAEALLAEASQAVEQSQAQIDRTNRNLNRVLAGIALLVLVVIIASGRFISTYITHPIRRLTTVATHLQDGRLSVRSNIQRADELGDLSNALNDMADQLQALVNQLETRVSERTHALELTTEKLRKADNIKNQFLASMSHELRTPLNAIINFNQFIVMELFGPINEQQRDYLNKTISSSELLLSLINDILDLAKIEAGRMRLGIDEDVNLRDDIDNACATVQSLLANKPHITFSADIPDTLPPVACDRRRVSQVLINLLSNAAKFTYEGHIKFTVTVAADTLQFSIADTGIGIDDEHITRIFEPFVQAAAGIREKNSTGLGLPISKRLIEMHGGTLTVTSEVDVGSTFIVLLPQDCRPYQTPTQSQ